MARSAACGALGLVLGWFAFVQGRRVPILGMVDLGVHELGHLLFSWAPSLLMLLAGNGTQTVLPLLVAGAFAYYKRDWAAAGLCLAWCGTTLQDASVYIADAPDQRLQLLKENSIHDWATILGAEHFYCLNKAAGIAHWVKGAGLVFLLAGVAVALWPAFEGAHPRNRVAADPRRGDSSLSEVH
jgi:hypothetical protein